MQKVETQPDDLATFVAKVQRMRIDGLRDPDIARKLGVEKSTLDKRLKDFRRLERRR